MKTKVAISIDDRVIREVDLLVRDVDDEQYLLEVIDEIADTVAVSGFAVFGHPMRGLMADTLSCRHFVRFAAVITVTGCPEGAAWCTGASTGDHRSAPCARTEKLAARVLRFAFRE